MTRRYNLFGQVISETNGRGLSSEWDYDSIGRCILFTLPDGSSVAYPTRGIHISAVQRKDPRGALLYEHSYSKYDIQVLPCISSKSDKNFGIADHGFLQPTYRKAWEENIKDLKQAFKFYGGSSNDQTR